MSNRFCKIKKIKDNSSVRELLYKIITGMYNSNTETLIKINDEIEDLKKEVEVKKAEIEETEGNIHILKKK